MKRLLPLLLTCLSAGCATQGVPSTHFTIVDPSTGAKLTYEGPKQVSIDSLETSYTRPGGVTASVKLKGLSATNEPSVIQQAGTADAARINATTGLVHEIGSTAQGLAEKAAAGAAKGVVP